MYDTMYYMLKLVNVDFRVCCSHKDHNEPCRDTMLAIRDNFFNIIKINTVKPVENSEDMCVIGKAKINPKKRKSFEDRLSKIQIGKKYIKTAQVSILYD